MTTRMVTRLVTRLIVWLILNAASMVNAQDLNLTAQEQAYLNDTRSLIVASEMDWPPFDYAVDGKPLGDSIELIEILAARLGVKPEFVTGLTWNELLDGFKSGEIDILPAVYRSEQRSEYIAFTQSYYSQPSVIVAKKNNQHITSFASLNGKRVAGVKGFAITDTLHQQYPQIQLVEFDTVVECLKAVSTGAVDAYY